MLGKLFSLLGPGFLMKMAGPSQMASAARTALKFLGGYLTSLGFSSAAVEGFQAGNEQIVAGLLSLGIGMVLSALDKKGRDE